MECNKILTTGLTNLFIQSCLALKYEALVLREAIHLKDRDLQVSYEEWLTFGRDALNNGFYTIAVRVNVLYSF